MGQSIENAGNEPFIFLHLTKTAGSTLRPIIARQYSPEVKLMLTPPSRIKELINMPETEWAKIRCLIAGHASFGVHRGLPGKVKYVTMLRHPIERLVSIYYYSTVSASLHTYELYKDVSIEDYARQSGEGHRQTWRLMDHDDVTNIEDRAEPLPPSALESAKRNLQDHFAVVGITEHFDESLLLMQKEFGWENIFYLKRNVNNKRKSVDALPPRTIAVLEELCALDLELYNFACELFDRRIREQGEGFADEVRSFQAANSVYARRHLFKTRMRKSLPWRALRSVVRNVGLKKRRI